MSKIARFALVTLLQFSLCSTLSPAQQSVCTNPPVNGICSTSVQHGCVNACTDSCGDIGECIFGCEIGGINNSDVCTSSCTGLGEPCLNSCMATVQCITTSCMANVTNLVALNLGTPVMNRATGVWQQTVKITNTCSAKLISLAFALDAIATGWTVTNSDGTTSTIKPSGSPYKLIGDLDTNASATVTIQFMREGRPTFTYSPRVITGSDR